MCFVQKIVVPRIWSLSERFEFLVEGGCRGFLKWIDFIVVTSVQGVRTEESILVHIFWILSDIFIAACLIHGPQMRKMKANRNPNEYISRIHRKFDIQKRAQFKYFDYRHRLPYISTKVQQLLWVVEVLTLNKVNFISDYILDSPSDSLFCLKRWQSDKLNWTQFVSKASSIHLWQRLQIFLQWKGDLQWFSLTQFDWVNVFLNTTQNRGQ